MNRLIRYLPCLFALLLLACTKDNNITEIKKTNIYLLDKPLDTIKFYVNKKWKLFALEGGILGRTQIINDGSYIKIRNDTIDVEFKLPNSINGSFKIDWKYGRSFFTGIDTYVLRYSPLPQTGPPVELDVYAIQNDTLILKDHYTDGYRHIYAPY